MTALYKQGLKQDVMTAMRLAFHLAILIAAVMAGFVVILSGSRAALAATLKDISIIRDDVIRVGDVFEGLTRNADHVLGPAPQPGQDLTLNTRTLMRIAHAMDLPWRPASSNEQVTLRRAATIISKDEIERGLIRAMAEQSMTGDFRFTYQSGMPQIILPDTASASFDVASFDYDPRDQSFTAQLVAPSKDDPVRRVTLSGMIQRMIEVPVLSRTLRNGDVVGASDLNWITIPEDRLQNAQILSEDQVLGKTPRRMVQSGEALRDEMFQLPQIIERGEDVTLIYKSGSLELTTRGRAVQAAAKGDVVRVINMASSEYVQGFVTGPKQVTVSQ